MKHSRIPAYTAVEEEILYAQGLDSTRVAEPQRPKTVGEYLTMLQVYLTRAQFAWTDAAGDANALDIVRKCAAIAVRCMEDNGVVRRVE